MAKVQEEGEEYMQVSFIKNSQLFLVYHCELSSDYDALTEYFLNFHSFVLLDFISASMPFLHLLKIVHFHPLERGFVETAAEISTTPILNDEKVSSFSPLFI